MIDLIFRQKDLQIQQDWTLIKPIILKKSNGIAKMG